MKLNKYIFQKIRAEFFFEPTGAFIDKRGHLLDLNKDKKQWSFRQYKNDRVIFTDDKSQSECLILWKYAMFDMEEPPNIGNYIDKLANTLSKEIWNTMEVSKFNQIKHHFLILFEADISFSELVNKVKPMLSYHEKLCAVGIPLKDVGISTEFEETGRHILLEFGPMENEQMKKMFFKYPDNLPVVAFFCRIVYTIKDPADLRIKTYSNQAIDFVINKAIPLIEEIFNEEMH